jgi:hypothetical protein
VGADGSCGEAERFFGLDGEFEVLTGGFCLDDPELFGFWAGSVEVEGGFCVKGLGEGDAGDEGSGDVHGEGVLWYSGWVASVYPALRVHDGCHTTGVRHLVKTWFSLHGGSGSYGDAKMDWNAVGAGLFVVAGFWG